MAKNKNELQELSNDVFFDNNARLIYPQEHRAFNNAMIEAMAMQSDLDGTTTRLARLENPAIPKHGRPIVVDEVLNYREGFCSWDRPNNHIIARPKNYARDGIMPIGEVIYYYEANSQGKAVRITVLDKLFGPTIQEENGAIVFVINEPGTYYFVVKNIDGFVSMENHIVTADQAQNGYKIQLPAEMKPTEVEPDRSSKQRRVFARLYTYPYLESHVYNGIDYSIKRGLAYKVRINREELNDAGAITGLNCIPLPSYGPFLDRSGKYIGIKTMQMPEIGLRPGFNVDMDAPIDSDVFLDNTHYEAREIITVLYKKRKSWQTNGEGERRHTRNVVGYSETNGLNIFDIRNKGGRLSPADAEISPYIIFKVVIKNASKTVLAYYKATLYEDASRATFRRM